MNFFLVVAYSSFFSAFIPAIVGLMTFRKTQGALKILSVFCVVTAIMECIHTYLGYRHINNMFMVHLYTPIEFTFFAAIFSSIFKQKKIRVFCVVLTCLFILFSVLNASYFESPKKFNSIARGVEGLILICFCLFYFYKLFTSNEFIDLLKHPFFWLFSGWLLYFSGTLFLFIYSNQGELNLTFSIIHSVLNIFLNLIFTYTLWLGSRKLILS